MREGFVQKLGIPGQDFESARVFRDKLTMKQWAVTHGVDTPHFAPIDNAIDLHDFANTVGYPFVVKPRTEGGGIGFSVIRSADEMGRILDASAADRPHDMGLNMIAEEFMHAREAHVDGIWGEGEFLAVGASLYRGPGS